MVVYWEPEARDNLKDIYIYYRKVAGQRIAGNIRRKIKQTADKLGHFPGLGTIEGHIESNITYRSISAHKHYKLLYRIENEIVFVTIIWDVRQDPAKLENIIRKP